MPVLRKVVGYYDDGFDLFWHTGGNDRDEMIQPELGGENSRLSLTISVQ